MIFKFGEQLMPMELADWEADPGPAVFVTDSRHAEGILAKAGIIYENEIQISKIGFCRLENQQDCVVGTLCIPSFWMCWEADTGCTFLSTAQTS